MESAVVVVVSKSFQDFAKFHLSRLQRYAQLYIFGILIGKLFWESGLTKVPSRGGSRLGRSASTETKRVSAIKNVVTMEEVYPSVGALYAGT